MPPDAPQNNGLIDRPELDLTTESSEQEGDVKATPAEHVAAQPTPNTGPKTVFTTTIPTRRRGVEGALGRNPFEVIDQMTKGLPGIMQTTFSVNSRPEVIAEVFSNLLRALSADDDIKGYGKDRALAVFRRAFIGKEFDFLDAKEQFVVAARYAMMLKEKEILQVLFGLFGVQRLDLFPRTQPSLVIALMMAEAKLKLGVQPIYQMLRDVQEGITPEQYNKLLEYAEILDAEVNSTLSGSHAGLAHLLAAKLLNYVMKEESDDLSLPALYEDDEDCTRVGIIGDDDKMIRMMVSGMNFDGDGPQSVHPSRIFPDAQETTALLGVLFEGHREIYEAIMPGLVKMVNSGYTPQFRVGFALKRYIDRFFEDVVGSDVRALKGEARAFLAPAITILTGNEVKQQLLEMGITTDDAEQPTVDIITDEKEGVVVGDTDAPVMDGEWGSAEDDDEREI